MTLAAACAWLLIRGTDEGPLPCAAPAAPATVNANVPRPYLGTDPVAAASSVDGPSFIDVNIKKVHAPCPPILLYPPSLSVPKVPRIALALCEVCASVLSLLQTHHALAGAAFDVQFDRHIMLLRAQGGCRVCGCLRSCGGRRQIELCRLAAHATPSSCRQWPRYMGCPLDINDLTRLLSEAAARLLAAALSLAGGWDSGAPSLKPLGEGRVPFRRLWLTRCRSRCLAPPRY